MLAVVVTTREQLWLLVVVMTDATGHLLLEISNNWSRMIKSLGHFQISLSKWITV